MVSQEHAQLNREFIEAQKQVNGALRSLVREVTTVPQDRGGIVAAIEQVSQRLAEVTRIAELTPDATDNHKVTKLRRLAIRQLRNHAPDLVEYFEARVQFSQAAAIYNPQSEVQTRFVSSARDRMDAEATRLGWAELGADVADVDTQIIDDELTTHIDNQALKQKYEDDPPNAFRSPLELYGGVDWSLLDGYNQAVPTAFEFDLGVLQKALRIACKRVTNDVVGLNFEQPLDEAQVDELEKFLPQLERTQVVVAGVLDVARELFEIRELIYRILHEHKVIDLGRGHPDRHLLLRPSTKDTPDEIWGEIQMFRGEVGEQNLERAETLALVVHYARDKTRAITESDLDFLRQLETRIISIKIRFAAMMRDGRGVLTVDDVRYIRLIINEIELYQEWVHRIVETVETAVEPPVQAEAGKWPYMGDHDASKRFFLHQEVNTFGWTYEQIKDWGLSDLVRALYAYVIDKIVRDLPPYEPFDNLDLLGFSIDLRHADGEAFSMSVKGIIQDLGGSNETLMYRIGSHARMLGAAYAFQHQYDRTQWGVLEKWTKAETPHKYHVQGFWDVTHEFKTLSGGTEVVELGPRRMPLSMGEMLRDVMSRMLMRAGQADQLIDDPNGGPDKVRVDKAYPAPLVHEGADRARHILAYDQLYQRLIQRIIDEIPHHTPPHGETPLDPNDPDDMNYIEIIARGVVHLAISFGEANFFRVLADVGASRYDMMEASSLYQYRRVAKGAKIGQDGRITKREGKSSIREDMLIFFERLWVMPMLRYRFVIPVLYEDEAGDLQVGYVHHRYQDLITNDAIPDEMDQTWSAAAKAIIGKAKAGTDIVTADIAAMPAGMAVPAYDESVPLRDRCVYLSSFETAIEKGYPGAPKNAEGLVIDHALKMKKLLEDWDLDVDHLPLKRGNMTGGESNTFNPHEAEKISAMMRSALYYWANDAVGYKFRDRDEYENARKNFHPPKRRRGESEADFNQRYLVWQQEWSWRGLPLQTVRRDSKGEIVLVDGQPVIQYVECSINHLFNFNLKKELHHLLHNREISRDLYNLLVSDFNRLMGDSGEIEDQDQLSLAMRIVMEKAIIIKLLNFRDSGKKWTAEHSIALTEAMCSSRFYGNREGLNRWILRKLGGVAGVMPGGIPVNFEGVGGWTEDEVQRIIIGVFGRFAPFQAKSEKK